MALPFPKWRSIERAVLLDALTEAIVGLFVAVIVAILILSSGFGAVGSDLSQRLYILVDRPGGALGSGVEVQPFPSSWVFLDLADGFCRNDDQVPRCPPKTLVTNRHDLATLLANVRSHQPKLVVLDVLTDFASDPSGDELILNELRKAGPPVLLAWRPKAASNGLENGLDAQLLFSPDNRSAPPYGRYLPALKTLDGAAARLLQPDYEITLSNQPVSITPGIAFGAALVLNAPPQTPFAFIDGYRRTQRTCILHAHASCGDYKRTVRVFSFPRRGPHGQTQLNLNGRTPSFLRFSPGPRDSLPAELRGAVIVIGNSDPDAGDTGWSALHEVSGAELVLNDIRQYLIAPPYSANGVSDRILLEAPFLLLGLLSILAAQISIDHVWPRTRLAPDAPWTPRRSRRHVIRIIAKLFITMLLSAVFYAGWLRFGLEPHGAPPDFITPYFAILCEALLELIHRAMNGLHILVHHVLSGHSASTVIESGED